MRSLLPLVLVSATAAAVVAAGPSAAAPPSAMPHDPAVTAPPSVVPHAPAVAPAATRAALAEQACAPVTDDALDAVLGGLPAELARDGVPGAVVSVVAGGRTVRAEGFGVADTATGAPMDADRSLVRIASITKLFTATAVMQQVEAGRLALDDDVNAHLTAFTVPTAFGEPVTVRDLLDHTAGFEERGIVIGARAAADVRPLGETLRRHLPARIYPPGEVAAYSNWGAALAGHLVEQVSGEPYDRYVRGHLLEPLGMTRTTAAEPVPDGLAADLAHSYDSEVVPPEVIPFTFDRLPPDGSVSATAADMARFVQAHLDGGGPVLGERTTALMHTRSFTADDRLPGSAHGFQERFVRGHRLLVHDGSWEGFQSALVLAPACGLGMFVSFNATGGARTLPDVVERFTDRFLPTLDGATPSPPAAASALPAHPAPLLRAGFYTRTRHNESSVERLLVLLDQSRLRVADDGTVAFAGTTWTATADGLHRSPDGGMLVPVDGRTGRHYVVTDGPDHVLLAAADTLPVNLAVLAVAVVVSLSAPAVVGVRRRARRRRSATTPRWRAARFLTAAATLGGTAFLVALGAELVGDSSEFLYEVPASFRVLLGGGVAVLATAAAGAVLTALAWRGSGATRAARVHQVVLLTGLVALTWFLARWNLVGWQLG